MGSNVDVTMADLVAGSEGCCRGAALVAGAVSHPDRKTAPSGTTRVIMWVKNA
jgi:hypothetical protein